jgi:hypothetical protein
MRITQRTAPKNAPRVNAALCFFVWASLVYGESIPTFGQAKGEIQIDLIDSKTSEKLPARVLLKGANGSPIKPKSIDQVQGWSLVEGQLAFRGKPGDYRYEVYHGPEYAPAKGQFTLDKRSEGIDKIELPRHADLSSEGWHGADLLSFRPKKSTDRWLSAELLSSASSIAALDWSGTPAAKEDIAFDGWMDDRGGSGLVFHHWSPSKVLSASVPSTQLIEQAKQAPANQGRPPVHVEVQNMSARDLPIWLATEKIDSIQMLSQHLTFDGSRATKVSPLVVPEHNFRGDRAPGRIIEQIYWRILDCGLRIPPTAGSGFGKSPSPLGYNRVYALVGSSDQINWWEAIRRGNSFVTNGPLLRVAINGMPPGHLFEFTKSVELDIGVALTTSDPVEYLEVIFNGSSIYKAALDEHAKKGGKIPPLEVKQSGWLVVRVVTAREFSYRMATTAPYYFELNGQRRVDPKSVEFFRTWLNKAKEQIKQLPAEVQKLHEPYLEAAEVFWNTRV